MNASLKRASYLCGHFSGVSRLNFRNIEVVWPHFHGISKTFYSDDIFSCLHLNHSHNLASSHVYQNCINLLRRASPRRFPNYGGFTSSSCT